MNLRNLSNLKNLKNQRGMTFVVWIALAALMAFFVMGFFKVFPAYMEHFAVKSALKSLAEDSTVKLNSKQKIHEKLSKYFQVNNIKRVDPTQLDIDKNNGQMILTMDYEIRVKLVSNIDAVLNFEDRVQVK